MEMIKGTVKKILPKEKNYLIFLDKQENGKDLMLSGWLADSEDKTRKVLPEGLEENKFYAFSCERNSPFINIKSFMPANPDGVQPQITEETVANTKTPQKSTGDTSKKYFLSDLHKRSIMIGQAMNLASQEILHNNLVKSEMSSEQVKVLHKEHAKRHFETLLELQEELL